MQSEYPGTALISNMNDTVEVTGALPTLLAETNIIGIKSYVDRTVPESANCGQSCKRKRGGARTVTRPPFDGIEVDRGRGTMQRRAAGGGQL